MNFLVQKKKNFPSLLHNFYSYRKRHLLWWFITEKIASQHYPQANFNTSFLIRSTEIRGLPRCASGKEAPANAEDSSFIPGSGRSPGQWPWQPTPVFLCGESHGQRNLVGYTSRVKKNWTLLKRLSVHIHTVIHIIEDRLVNKKVQRRH